MKAIIENGKIFNFVDDSYIAGNKEIDGGVHPTIKIEKIEGFAADVDMDEVAKNNTRVKGCFIYYLEKGIVQQLKIEEQPEYKEYQKRQRSEAYKNESDPIAFKVLRGEATEEEYKSKVQEIKDRYPY